MRMPAADQIVFLLDVDNTLLDNDRAQDEYLRYIAQECGPEAAARYWDIFQQLVAELGYADYLAALQRYRLEDMYDPNLLRVSAFLLDYPFAERLYPHVLDVIAHLRAWGKTVILTDGDVVFQPRKIERSGLWRAVDGNVLIYIHKEQELDEIARRYPAAHYILIDDKIRILAAIKQQWAARVTTVFVRQGHYALDQKTVALYPPADVSIERIGDLQAYKLADLLGNSTTEIIQ